MKTRLFYLHALTPLHVGVGQAIGMVDLPIMRERSTQLPIVPGSTLKGVLRDEWAALPDDSPWAFAKRDLRMLMGPETLQLAEQAHGSALAWGDARPLLLPVRSLVGVMAWVTCPYVLRRFARDAQLADRVTPAVPSVANQALTADKHSAVATQVEGRLTLVLEDLELPATYDQAAAEWAKHLAQALTALEGDWPALLPKQFVVLPDDDFVFLAETATEIRARVSIDDDTRIVRKGALWYEENLPAETVLWGVLGVGPSRLHDRRDSEDEINHRLPPAQPLTIQVGGKQTVGRGLCRWVLA